MNDLVKQGHTGGTGVATQANANTATNYYTAYGDQVASRMIRGKLLKFSKGDYLAGEQNEDVEAGTRFIAKMDDLMVGWQCWKDNKPTDAVMGRLGDGFQPPRRETLGDDDESQWEADPQSGELRDPWQFSNAVLLRILDEQDRVTDGDDDESRGIYTFTTSSRGGINAMGALAKKYGSTMRQHPDEWPVIQIGVDSYNHKNKQFGRIKVPMFKVVGWVPKSMFVLDDEDAEQQQLPLDDTRVSEKPKTGGARF